jgi:hypothetical protein
MADRSSSMQSALVATASSDPDLDALSDLSRALEGVAAVDVASGGRAGGVGEVAAEIELRTTDLIGDDNGEIVFFNDSGVRTLGITADTPVVADGRIDAHVTAAGADVTGYRFVTFENGPTLFFEDGLNLIVHTPEPAVA